MPRIASRREFLLQAAVTAVAASGCGTIFYPERRGQPAGLLDWKVVALDTLGLLFFFIPGVIAFAVDFNNGTIYLPPEECADDDRETTPELTSIDVPRDQLTLPGIETTVSERTQKQVRLEPGRFETHALNDIREFWPFHRRCSAA